MDRMKSFVEKQILQAQSYETTIEEIEELKKEKIWQVDWALATNPNTPIHILEEFLERGEPFLNKRLASNLGAPVEFLEKLSRTNSDEIHIALLNNMNTPVTALVNIVKRGEKYTSERAQKVVNRKLFELQKIWTEE